MMPMARDNNINKTAEQYRWLAASCRETARTASDGKERAHLLAPIAGLRTCERPTAWLGM
jgi:hypothetical protein